MVTIKVVSLAGGKPVYSALCSALRCAVVDHGTAQSGSLFMCGGFAGYEGKFVIGGAGECSHVAINRTGSGGVSLLVSKMQWVLEQLRIYAYIVCVWSEVC